LLSGGELDQSPMWMESSSWRAMPPSTLPRVACSERPSTTVTTAEVGDDPRELDAAAVEDAEKRQD